MAVRLTIDQDVAIQVPDSVRFLTLVVRDAVDRSVTISAGKNLYSLDVQNGGGESNDHLNLEIVDFPVLERLEIDADFWLSSEDQGRS